jgi:2-polyprenyl-6-methoxyphenol hydroxylase-like FAD-dependent oxidoreductase
MRAGAPPSVAIVGGGPGGLVLARLLQLHDVPFTLYEREPSHEARDQGGTLDLHEDSGLIAIQRAQLEHEFWRLARPEGNAVRVLDLEGTVHMDETDEDAEAERPEIDRRDLRTMLIQSVDPERVEWGRKVTAVERRATEPHTIHFEHGDSARADVVVGADGAWSAVRPLLSRAVPTYVGLTFVELQITDIDARYPDSAAVVGPGSLFALAPDRGIIAQRGRGNCVRIYASLCVAEDWSRSCGIDWTDPDVGRAALVAKFAGWSLDLARLIERCEGEMIARPLYALPSEHRWAPVGGLTLLGDAAHLMAPFGGHGANLAMLDGALLGTALAEDLGDVDRAISVYEHALFPRSRTYALESEENMAGAFRSDAPRGMVAGMERARGH